MSDYHRTHVPTAASAFRPLLATLSRPFGAAVAALRRPLPDAPAVPGVIAPRPVPGRSPAAIPKVIWSYWHSESRPPTVDLCFANWRAFSPGYAVHVLNAGNLGEFLPAQDLPRGFAGYPEWRRADWVRMALLRRHGGLWLDASIFLTESLDWMLDAQRATGAGYVGFHYDRWGRPGDVPVIENWCMAAPPGSRFVDAWYRELTDEVLEKGEHGYQDRLRACGALEQTVGGIPFPDYLIMHLAARRVLLTQSHEDLYLVKAEDSAYFYFEARQWRSKRMFRDLVTRRPGRRVAPLVKLRAPERRRVDRMVRWGLVARGSLVDHYLVALER